MQDDYDAEYYRKREATERDLADKSNDPGISLIHRQMAEEYARKTEAADRPALRIVPAN